MARIRALLRQHAGTPEEAAVFNDGRLHIDLARREVRLNGERLALGRKEYALLALLLKHSGRVVTQPQILRELWGSTHTQDTHYVRVLVGKLRQRLGDDAADPRWIATEPGVGLRFVQTGQTLPPS
jgi:two-component system KDP operon response regulator KdpE